MKLTFTTTAAAFCVYLLAPSIVSAQSAGSWVDIASGKVGAGADASGMIQIANSKSQSKNGVDFGHGFALGAGPNGLAISNSVGVGGGPVGASHNMQLNVGRGGAHLSHSGVATQGGNRRVVSGGNTGSFNGGQVYGGSQSRGYGHNTHVYSQSHTRQWNPPSQIVPFSQAPISQTPISQGPSFSSQPVYSQPNRTSLPIGRAPVIRGGGMRLFRH